jgi:hypothetical protein
LNSSHIGPSIFFDSLLAENGQLPIVP